MPTCNALYPTVTRCLLRAPSAGEALRSELAGKAFAAVERVQELMAEAADAQSAKQQVQECVDERAQYAVAIEQRLAAAQAAGAAALAASTEGTATAAARERQLQKQLTETHAELTQLSTDLARREREGAGEGAALRELLQAAQAAREEQLHAHQVRRRLQDLRSSLHRRQCHPYCTLG